MSNFFTRMINPFEKASGPPPNSFLPFILWSVKGAKKTILIATLASFSVGIAEAFGAIIIGWVIDTAITNDPSTFVENNFRTLIAISIFFVIIRPILMTISAAINGIAMVPNLFPLTFIRLHRHTLGQSIKFFDDDFAGRLAQKQVQTATSISETFNEITNAFSFAIATLVASGFILGSVSSWLTIILLIWIFSFSILIKWFLPHIRLRSKNRAAARAAVTGQVVDTLTNMATVKLFVHSDGEEHYAEEALKGFRKKSIDFAVLYVSFRAAIMTLAGLLPILLIGGGIFLWQNGLATPGDIVIAGLLSTRLAQMSGWISFTAMNVFSHLGEAEDGMNTLSPKHDLTDKNDANVLKGVKGQIEFKNVTYNYGNDLGGGLNDFNLIIPNGQKVGLVGRSGAGKTTALALLLRFYDIKEGKIFLDGNNIQNITQDSLRQQISMVRQETSMFNRSARDNILYGNPNASIEDLNDAISKAQASNFINDLQDLQSRKGLDAFLGERGVKLSGGQRQRIALARAILKDAPVLALDEATSALDSEAEEYIQKALEELMIGKTVIAIAHRLSTISKMDRIIVMENGRVEEDGTHSQLLEKGGLYANFWTKQSGGFIGNV
ncbi:ABC transporter ATP-binding protein/permease [Paracoccaceae bacterium]|nr:ABC transporter ATP-binding protein/permease [Paracoccaceae bacterium]|tara:strand:+ start:1562 stop:3391 length:1830 start_codon:yes stop_codon:yes gene_type:complete